MEGLEVIEGDGFKAEAVEVFELKASDLVLQVERQQLGVLETNAANIKAAVLKALPNYTPENYVGRLDDLKRDKAALNNAAKELNTRRIALEKDFNKPFENFKSLIAETVKAIEGASSKLGDVVNSVEAEEKRLKKDQIFAYWTASKFPFKELFDKIFDQKWLNKGTKIGDVYCEIDNRCEKILNEIKLLERFPAEDIDTIKAYYLDTLDMAMAVTKAESLKKNREAVAREQSAREAEKPKQEEPVVAAAQAPEPVVEETKQPEQIETQTVEPQVEKTDEKPDIEMCFRLDCEGKASLLGQMRTWMNEHGVKYTVVARLK